MTIETSLKAQLFPAQLNVHGPWFQAFFDRNVIQKAEWAEWAPLAKTRWAKEETGERMASSDCSCSTVTQNLVKFVNYLVLNSQFLHQGKCDSPFSQCPIDDPAVNSHVTRSNVDFLP